MSVPKGKSKKTTAVMVSMGTVAVLVAFVYLTPLITVYRIIGAVLDKEGKTLERLVDFPSLRASVKAVMVAMAKGEGRLPAQVFVDHFVERLVTPEGFATQLGAYLQKRQEGGNGKTVFGTWCLFIVVITRAEACYRSSREYVVTFREVGEGKMAFVLTRNGFNWRLSKVETDVR